MRAMRTIAFLAALVVAAPAVAVAQPPKLKPLAQRIVSAGTPGAVVYVRDRTGVRAAAAGHADLRKKKLLTPAMSFRVGSITKSFVAAVVLQLVGEGKLTLADTLDHWLPGVVPGASQITVRELLNHTSGIPNYTSEVTFDTTLVATPSRVWTPLELVSFVDGRPPLFAPGSVWYYSNTNFILLGLIVERITGRPLGDELRDRIFEPLRLAHTSFPTASTSMPKPFAHGYLLPNNGLVPVRTYKDVTAWNPSWAWAAGAIVSTADDLARFYGALLAGDLLTPELLAAMENTVPVTKDPDGPGYGLGLMHDVDVTACTDTWGHDGAVPGYTGFVLGRRDGSRVAVVLVNASVTIRRVGEVVLTQLGTAFCSG
jgi:D-alanyl-D-alanine carboxypeptidase